MAGTHTIRSTPVDVLSTSHTNKRDLSSATNEREPARSKACQRQPPTNLDGDGGLNASVLHRAHALERCQHAQDAIQRATFINHARMAGKQASEHAAPRSSSFATIPNRHWPSVQTPFRVRHKAVTHVSPFRKSFPPHAYLPSGTLSRCDPHITTGPSAGPKRPITFPTPSMRTSVKFDAFISAISHWRAAKSASLKPTRLMPDNRLKTKATTSQHTAVADTMVQGQTKRQHVPGGRTAEARRRRAGRHARTHTRTHKAHTHTDLHFRGCAQIGLPREASRASGGR